MRKLSSSLDEKGEYRNAFLFSNEEKDFQFLEDEERKSQVSSEKQMVIEIDETSPTKKTPMRKAHLEESVKSLQPIRQQSKEIEAGLKLNAQMLERLEQDQPSYSKYQIPSDSYLEEVKIIKTEYDEDYEINIKYLEKKYLSPEFLFHNLETQNSAIDEGSNPNIIFEHLVNTILAQNYIDYKWYFYIHLYIHKIINNVRPNPNRQREVIKYNDYVTIR